MWYSMYIAVFQCHRRKLFLTREAEDAYVNLPNILAELKFFYNTNIDITLLNLIHFYLFLACYCPFFEYFTGTTCKRNQLHISSPTTCMLKQELVSPNFVTAGKSPKFPIGKVKVQVSKLM